MELTQKKTIAINAESKTLRKCLFWKEPFGSSVDGDVANKNYSTNIDRW